MQYSALMIVGRRFRLSDLQNGWEDHAGIALTFSVELSAL
jgi:hypothetical protein